MTTRATHHQTQVTSGQTPQHRRGRHVLLLLFVCALLMAGVLGACGREVTFTGAACAADFRLLAGEQRPRLGCLVFSHLKDTKAVIFGMKDGYWQMYYCPTTDRQTCTIAAAPVTFGNVRAADEIAVVAFPPLAEAETHSGAKAFLAFCAKRFAPSNPTVPQCQNDGSQQTSAELKPCWAVFHFSYNRSDERGVCTRWQTPP